MFLCSFSYMYNLNHTPWWKLSIRKLIVHDSCLHKTSLFGHSYLAVNLPTFSSGISQALDVYFASFQSISFIYSSNYNHFIFNAAGSFFPFHAYFPIASPLIAECNQNKKEKQRTFYLVSWFYFNKLLLWTTLKN